MIERGGRCAGLCAAALAPIAGDYAFPVVRTALVVYLN